MHRIIIVGGGAAGMMAAIAAKEKNIHGECEVDLFDGNEKLGKKLFITGKGRCNVTNASDSETFFRHIVTNSKFLFSSFYQYMNQDIIELLEEEGVRTKVERGNRVFPVSDKSSDIIHALEKRMKKLGVKVHLNQKVKKVLTRQEMDAVTVSGVVLDDGTTQLADSVIIATGGNSYQSTGSDGDGYRFARDTGHTVTEILPALVPLTVEEEDAKQMQGLSLKNVKATFYLHTANKKKELYSEQGELMFTHFGVTGPVILSGSSYIIKELEKKNGLIELIIDMKPAMPEEMLDKRILRDFEERKNKNFNHALDDLLPKTMIPVIINRAKIDPYKKVNMVTKEERERLVKVIKNLSFVVNGTRGFKEAIVTQGGISVKEINPKTMESKKIKNMYFAGEVMDLDATTGGYNLQIAWSTGHAAGVNA